MNRSGLAALTVLVLGAIGVAGIAVAGDVATYDSKVRMSERAPAFHGKVKSDSDLCVAGRKVKLFRKRGPNRPKKALGTDRANGNGYWTVREPDEFTLTSGLYWAKVKRIRDDSTGLPTFCTRDTSRRVFVD